MKRTNYALPDEYSNITEYDLAHLEDLMSLEELKEMRRKTAEYIDNRGWSSVEQKALAILVFQAGYKAAHIDYVRNNDS